MIACWPWQTKHNAHRAGLCVRVFSVENLTGDVRSAFDSCGNGSVIAAVGGLIAAALIAKPLSYTVFLNEDGFGQPRALFISGKIKSPIETRSFSPSELRNVYVCEYKHVTGPNYTEEWLLISEFSKNVMTSQPRVKATSKFSQIRGARDCSEGKAPFCVSAPTRQTNNGERTFIAAGGRYSIWTRSRPLIAMTPIAFLHP